MNTKQVVAVCAAFLVSLLIAGCAQESPPATHSSQSPDQSSYGGTNGVRTVAGGRHQQGTCSAAPNCDIFFGQ
jgi:hypothetical protein